MPAPGTASVQITLNGGAPQTGGITAALGDTVQLSNAAVGVSHYRWEIYSYPSGFATPAGWTLAASGTLYSLDATPPPFDVDPWGKYLVRLLVDAAITDETVGVPYVDDASAVSVESPSGLVDVAAWETSQFGGTSREWVGGLQANLRTIEGLLAAGTAGGPVRQVRMTASHSAASHTSSTDVPANAKPTRLTWQNTAAWSGGTTIAIGRSGSTALLLDTTYPLDLTTVGVPQVIDLPLDTAWGASALPLLITVGGAPAAGSAICRLEYD